MHKTKVFANASRISAASYFNRRCDLVAVIGDMVENGHPHPAHAKRHLLLKLGCEKLALKLARRAVRRSASHHIEDSLS